MMKNLGRDVAVSVLSASAVAMITAVAGRWQAAVNHSGNPVLGHVILGTCLLIAFGFGAITVDILRERMDYGPVLGLALAAITSVCAAIGAVPFVILLVRG